MVSINGKLKVLVWTCFTYPYDTLDKHYFIGGFRDQNGNSIGFDYCKIKVVYSLGKLGYPKKNK